MATFRPLKPRILAGRATTFPWPGASTTIPWTVISDQEGDGTIAPFTQWVATRGGHYLVIVQLTCSQAVVPQIGIFLLRRNGATEAAVRVLAIAGTQAGSMARLMAINPGDVVQVDWTNGATGQAVSAASHLDIARAGPVRWTS